MGMARRVMPVSLPQDNYSASLRGRSRRDFIAERAQFLLGGCQRRLTKTGNCKYGFVATVEPLEELTKVLDASLFQGLDRARGNTQLFDGTLGRTLQFFLDLL